ncbi:thrombospondin-type laminin G domain and EAR repeat-containing protein-like isoform X2 [Betta splendens]|uniref:Thrombospondin-type laminin G domain and EAR repeat-containing protein-like isoform X2 n=1 Tax=Betta splendens TaxID=158456 RepID=A0A6P7LGG6_BETSP|nr:thrombospondin-type laminin G domain and EAR repeat-containing protein-like isoform X2 [Betta splendens]
MLAHHCLIFTWVLVTSRVHNQSWRPCTDLLPLDLLDRALPLPRQAQHTQMQMVQSKGSRGLRLGGAMALSFHASQIFINCDYFPAEFSLVATVKIPKLQPKTNQYIFSLVEETSDSLLLGLRVSNNHLHFITMPTGKRGRSRLSYKDIGLDDNRWHTMVLAITGPYATLTLDCGLPLQLKQAQSFPTSLSTRGSRFYIGSRRRWRGRFSGLLRQLVLLPGSDATPQLCPTSYPSLAELSIPQVLTSTPLLPDHQGQVYAYEAETRVTVGNPPLCSRTEHGQLWFNAQSKGLLICDGLSWRDLLQNRERLDYVEDYQDLYTGSETFDIEIFSIRPEGLFMAAANRDSRPGSGIYKWSNGLFQLYQNISTHKAQAWKYFTVGNMIFLVVANSREVEPEVSIIFRWNKRQRRFIRYQTLKTHAARDWEAFIIHNQSFLVVANHRQESNHNIQSVIYRWNPNTKLFEVNQTLSTSGAYDWEFFTVGPYHFLAVANTFDGQTTTISSTIYVWVNGRFQTFQNIPTLGATDWETFQINGRFFLAVANSQKVSEHGPNVYSINSTVYELNMLTQSFIPFQDILTHSAVDWEFFSVGEEKFLVVANSHDGISYSQNSVVYSATSRLSKVFKLKTY